MENCTFAGEFKVVNSWLMTVNTQVVNYLQ